MNAKADRPEGACPPTTCSAGLVLRNGGLPPDHFDHALTRIDQADVSRKCKRLARLSREFAFQALGPCSVFWDTDEDSITFEAMHHEGSFVVHGDSEPNVPVVAPPPQDSDSK